MVEENFEICPAETLQIGLILLFSDNKVSIGLRTACFDFCKKCEKYFVPPKIFKKKSYPPKISKKIFVPPKIS